MLPDRLPGARRGAYELTLETRFAPLRPDTMDFVPSREAEGVTLAGLRVGRAILRQFED